MSDISELISLGFNRIGSYRRNETNVGRLDVDFALSDVRRECGVYVFVSGQKVVYVGSSIGNGGALRSRLRKYTQERAADQLEKKRRVHRLLREIVNRGDSIDIFVYFPQSRIAPVGDDGMHVDVVIGIEGWLIQKYRPDGNIRGQVKGASVPDIAQMPESGQYD